MFMSPNNFGLELFVCSFCDEVVCISCVFAVFWVVFCEGLEGRLVVDTYDETLLPAFA